MIFPGKRIKSPLVILIVALFFQSCFSKLLWTKSRPKVLRFQIHSESFHLFLSSKENTLRFQPIPVAFNPPFNKRKYLQTKCFHLETGEPIFLDFSNSSLDCESGETENLIKLDKLEGFSGMIPYSPYRIESGVPNSYLYPPESNDTSYSQKVQNLRSAFIQENKDYIVVKNSGKDLIIFQKEKDWVQDFQIYKFHSIQNSHSCKINQKSEFCQAWTNSKWNPVLVLRENSFLLSVYFWDIPGQFLNYTEKPIFLTNKIIQSSGQFSLNLPTIEEQDQNVLLYLLIPVALIADILSSPVQLLYYFLK